MKGLTLIEVLVGMGISAVAGVLLLVIVVQSTGLFTDQSAKLETGLSLNDALGKVRTSIKQATLIEATSSAVRLILKASSINSEGNVINDTYDIFDFYKDQNVLHFKVIPSSQSTRPLSDQILASLDNLLFEYFNAASPPIPVPPNQASKVRVTMTIKGAVATSEANLRND